MHEHHSRAAVPPGFCAVFDTGRIDIRHWVIVELVVPEYVVGRCPGVDLERAMLSLWKSLNAKKRENT